VLCLRLWRDYLGEIICSAETFLFRHVVVLQYCTVLRIPGLASGVILIAHLRRAGWNEKTYDEGLTNLPGRFYVTRTMEGLSCLQETSARLTTSKSNAHFRNVKKRLFVYNFFYFCESN